MIKGIGMSMRIRHERGMVVDACRGNLLVEAWNIEQAEGKGQDCMALLGGAPNGDQSKDCSRGNFAGCLLQNV